MEIKLLLSSFGVRFARPGETEDTLSVQRPQPHTTNPYKEDKDKIVGAKKERADHANNKALTLLLKPASPTPSNTHVFKLISNAYLSPGAGCTKVLAVALANGDRIHHDGCSGKL